MKVKVKMLVAFLMCMCLIPNLEAQTMHVLLTGATNDRSIGLGAKKNLQNYSTMLQSVIAALDCNYSFSVYDDPLCTKANVINWINELELGSDDVVVFYYSGHGGRALNDPDPFPQMCMNRPDNESLYMPVKQVKTLLEKKDPGPRLAIIITECCNSESAGIRIKPLFAMSTEKYISLASFNEKALRDLFFNTKGLVMISSSKAKEYSFICPTLDSNGGGIFSNQFLDSFYGAVKEGSITARWDAIFRDTHDEVYGQQIPYKGKMYRQEPISEISENLKKDKVIEKRKDEVKTETLHDVLQFLCNRNIDVDSRLAKVNAIKSRFFTPDAKVATIAANGTTIVDYEDADVFLKRIVLSSVIKGLAVVDGSNNKNSLIKVHELHF